ncbi:MAG: zinc-dependent alcohol dehydrogenase [Promethearchaeota archaeon]|jgi:propanol-preferring alcohol dehydrogenase
MKTVHILGNEEVEVVDIPEPEPKDDLVVVKILSSGICGTEHTSYFGKNKLKYNSGHEAAGTVWKTDNAKTVKKGDRVSLYPTMYYYCHKCPPCLAGDWYHCHNPVEHQRFPGTHSQYELIREDCCLPIPDDVPFDTAALIDDCLGTPYRGITRLGMKPTDTVLITGVGPIGVAATIISKFFNAKVIAVDVNNLRLKHVQQYGVEQTINPREDNLKKIVRKITKNRGVDIALECSGMEEAQNECLDAVKPLGKVAFLGIKSINTKINIPLNFIIKEITAIGSWASRPYEHPEIIKMIQLGLPADQLITHKFKIDDASTAFETFFSGSSVKVIINPWD